MNQLHRYLLTAGLLGALGAAAVAQTPAAPQAPAAAAAPRMMQGQPGMMGQERMHGREQRAQRRLDELRQILRITPQQEAAWSTWTSALRPVRLQRPDRVEFARMSTPERINSLKALQAQRSAVATRRLDATQSFYTALDAEQQKLFDAQGMRYLRAGGEGKRGMRGHHFRHHRG